MGLDGEALLEDLDELEDDLEEAEGEELVRDSDSDTKDWLRLASLKASDSADADDSASAHPGETTDKKR